MEIHSPPGSRAPGGGSPSSAPVAPGGAGSAPRRGCEGSAAHQGTPRAPSGRTEPPPLPTPSPAGRTGPARLRRELRPPHASAHRGNSAPARGAAGRGLLPSPLFKPLPAVSASLAPTRSLRPAELTGAAPPLPMYTQPHAARRSARPPQTNRPLVQQPARQHERLHHWLAALSITTRPALRPAPPLPGHLGGVKTAV